MSSEQNEMREIVVDETAHLQEELSELKAQREALLNQVMKCNALLTASAQACYNATFLTHMAANEHAYLRVDNKQKALHWTGRTNRVETQLKNLLEALQDQGFVPILKGMPE